MKDLRWFPSISYDMTDENSDFPITIFSRGLVGLSLISSFEKVISWN